MVPGCCWALQPAPLAAVWLCGVFKGETLCSLSPRPTHHPTPLPAAVAFHSRLVAGSCFLPWGKPLSSHTRGKQPVKQRRSDPSS